jgi:hypothetical protein
MKLLIIVLIAAVFAFGSGACRENRDDETNRGEQHARLDTTQGNMPTH